MNHNTNVNGVQVNNRMRVTDRTDTSGTRRVRFLTARRRLWLAGLGALAVLALLAVVSLRDGSGHSPHPGVPQALAAGAAPDPTTRARLDARRRIPGDPLALGPVAAPRLAFVPVNSPNKVLDRVFGGTHACTSSNDAIVCQLRCRASVAASSLRRRGGGLTAL
jgi:hypothetical protein